MRIETVIYRWEYRPLSLVRRTSRKALRSTVSRARKFLLFVEDDRYVIVIGPSFSWPVEYHHSRLRGKFTRESDAPSSCAGGGVLHTERRPSGAHVARLVFWQHCPCGQYDEQLAGLEEDVSQALKCRVEITTE